MLNPWCQYLREAPGNRGLSLIKRNMELKKIKRARNIEYYVDLTHDDIGTPVLEFESHTAYKLQIKTRSVDPKLGEVNFLIRDNSNNLRYVILYCFIENPGEICSCSYYINSRVLLPSGENAYCGELMDEEIALYLCKELIEKYLKKTYKLLGQSATNKSC